MSSDAAIKISNVSKYYQIYNKPLDRLKQSLFRGRKQFYNEFKAIDNATFEIKRGETTGIIGRNGSGKSTLLQIICGILTPTGGEVYVNGKVAALLELGAGFNPEFTGRENVIFNASLYGLTDEEISERFDRIVAFADIGDFIDQPVKTYSSGMYVRLAFSVIAHVDADILVIDEALAVGDAYFVQKCMRFLRSFTEQGTLLFVSHDTGSVVNLCKNAILLNSGEVERIGAAKDVSEYYLRLLLEANDQPGEEALSADFDVSVQGDVYEHESEDAPLVGANDFNTGDACIYSVAMSSGDEVLTVFKGGEEVDLRIRARALHEIDSPIIGFFVKDRLGQTLFGMHSYEQDASNMAAVSGQVIQANFRFTLPLLARGSYSITVSISSGTPESHKQLHWLHDALVFEMVQENYRYGLIEIECDDVELKIYE